MAESAWMDLLDGIAARLGDRGEFANDLRALRDVPAGMPTDSEILRLPVQRHWPGAGAEDPLGRLMARIDGDLAAAWRQNPNYRAAPPSDGFLSNYGYLECAGPDAPFLATHIRLGLLLLGPGTLYPPHHHPAEEVYLPLGTGRWWKEGDGWQERSSGDVIHHPPMCAHATESNAAPLAAIYLWRGAIARAAEIA